MPVNDKISVAQNSSLKKIDYLVLFMLMYQPSSLLARFCIKDCVFISFKLNEKC